MDASSISVFLKEAEKNRDRLLTIFFSKDDSRDGLKMNIVTGIEEDISELTLSGFGGPFTLKKDGDQWIVYFRKESFKLTDIYYIDEVNEKQKKKKPSHVIMVEKLREILCDMHGKNNGFDLDERTDGRIDVIYEMIGKMIIPKEGLSWCIDFLDKLMKDMHTASPESILINYISNLILHFQRRLSESD